ncbi:phytoene desaturase family protein [Gulosibacter massiliensis]|uniref:phytoene desaturase family protein n=1 Tax=Gulosibacter massiliensis TaxID=2479839 RepID=UPI000F6356B3|nr:NAD(P)/FAD-dependent oxidoreductase [Gulosibacter massiliensis]
MHTHHGRRANVVGAGPNGLTAAAVLAKAGWQVDIYERADRPGGAAATTSALGPGTLVDLGAAAHPFGVASRAFRELELTNYGLEWQHSGLALAHPLPGGDAGLLHHQLGWTAEDLGADAAAWRRLHRPATDDIDALLNEVLQPLAHLPRHPVQLARFAPAALAPASTIARRALTTPAARALFLGSAAHAFAPLQQPLTGAFGVLFGALGMTDGWPVAAGGSQAITDALLAVARAHGARLHLDHEVTDLRELPPADATVLALTPRQIARLGGASELPRGLRRWRHGASAFKVDYLLREPIPWTNPRVAEATTVHVVGTAEELLLAEREVARDRLPEHPFVLLTQQQAADRVRAPGDSVVVSGYAHVPHGYAEWREDEVVDRIERQLERFAPGFCDTVVFRRTTSPEQLEAWNPNLVGGDIAGGAMTGTQLLRRFGVGPNPYRLAPGTYLASASAPPGAGVHGMPGYWAAKTLIADTRET